MYKTMDDLRADDIKLADDLTEFLDSIDADELGEPEEPFRDMYEAGHTDGEIADVLLGDPRKARTVTKWRNDNHLPKNEKKASAKNPAMKKTAPPENIPGQLEKLALQLSDASEDFKAVMRVAAMSADAFADFNAAVQTLRKKGNAK